MKKKKSRFEKWLYKDANRILYEAFAGVSGDEIILDHQMRMAAAGFGKRYRKRSAFNAAIIISYAEATMKANPKIHSAELAAHVLLQRGCTPSELYALITKQ